MAKTDHNDGEAATARVPRERLEAAMQDVAEVRREFVYATQIGAEADERLLRRFHAAVMHYYLELANYRDEDAVSDRWQEIELWPGAEGAPKLEQFMDQKVKVQKENPGLDRGSSTEMKPYHLPGDKLVAAAAALDELAKEMGLAVNMPESTPRTEIEDEMFDKVDEWWKANIRDGEVRDRWQAVDKE